MRTLHLAVAMTLAAAAPLSAQQLDGIAREQALAMLNDVHHDIQRHYYDSTFRGIDLSRTFAQADSAIRRANSMAEALIPIAQATLALNDSHTFFVPPKLTVQVDYGWSARMIGDSCLVDSVTKGSDAEKQGLEPGDAILAINGHVPTRRTLLLLMYGFHWVRPQRGLHVSTSTRQLDLAAIARQRQRVIDLTGMDGGRDIWRLINDEEDDARRWRSEYSEVGDALIWRLPTFETDADVVQQMMGRARKKSTLVLDLRGNGGGLESTMLALLGELFDHDVAIGTLRQRTGNRPLVAKSHGDHPYSGKLLVLIDSRSASASEIVARTVQLQHRGSVMGDRSTGMVMRSQGYEHAQGAETQLVYATSVTDADITMSDGTVIEGMGVTPDVIVLPSSADLRAHRDPVLERALAQ
jgi:C-terminal processing protease CtpA/Prc